MAAVMPSSVACPPGNAYPSPGGLDMTQAAALPEGFFTVWNNVVMRAGLRPARAFLSMAAPAASAPPPSRSPRPVGANEALATASTAEKMRPLRDARRRPRHQLQDRGFRRGRQGRMPVGRRRRHPRHDRRRLCGPQTSEALATEGRLVQIAFDQGAKVEVNLMPVMLKRLTITGSTLRPRSSEFKAEIARQLRERIWPGIEDGTVRPIVTPPSRSRRPPRPTV